MNPKVHPEFTLHTYRPKVYKIHAAFINSIDKDDNDDDINLRTTTVRGVHNSSLIKVQRTAGATGFVFVEGRGQKRIIHRANQYQYKIKS